MNSSDILNRMTNIPGVRYKSEKKDLYLGVRFFKDVFITSIGDDCVAFTTQSSSSYEDAMKKLVNVLFKNKRNREVKRFFNRIGLPENVSIERMMILIDLMGL